MGVREYAHLCESAFSLSTDIYTHICMNSNMYKYANRCVHTCNDHPNKT